MLQPGVTLHVYGVVGPIEPQPLDSLRDLEGILEDGGYSYLVFSYARKQELCDLGIEPNYEASLKYEQWLDGDVTAPIAEAGLTIVPPWCTAPESAANTLHITPSLVFGTGAHPTTRRCLRLIEGLLHPNGSPPPKTVLDLGCGTGVLGLAALRLGAHKLWGCDISQLAIDVARANAQRNDLAEKVVFTRESALSLARPADLVLANLPPAALSELLVHPSLDQAQWIITSGMLRSDLARLLDNLPHQVELVESFIDGCWHTALLTRA